MTIWKKERNGTFRTFIDTAVKIEIWEYDVKIVRYLVQARKYILQSVQMIEQFETTVSPLILIFLFW